MISNFYLSLQPLNPDLLAANWPDVWEYIWIILWGSVGLVLGRLSPSPTKHFSIIIVLGIVLIGFSYGCLLLGLWIPLVPALIAFGLNSLALYAFYLYDQGLRVQIQERQRVIESSFDALHNGPLQTLAALLRQEKDQGELLEQYRLGLQNLNQELRDVYEALRQETVAQSNQLVIGSHLTLDPQIPLRESLYEVYTATLQRDLPCFKGLKVIVVKFDSLDGQALSPELKRDLCRFLEEALCNVGKYAMGVTRLTVTCGQEGDLNFIRIQDNGLNQLRDAENPSLPQQEGRGSQQAKRLARQLRGAFQRCPILPKGTICELSWPSNKKLAIWQFWRI